MNTLRALLVAVGVAMLSACGGGGSAGPTDSGSDAVAKFEGLFEGTVDARQSWFRMLVLPDGEVFIIYGDRRTDGPMDLGYATGMVSQDGNVIRSVGIVDYGRSAGAPLQIEATIDSRAVVAGTLTGLAINSGSPAAFILERVVVGYDFSAPPSLPEPTYAFFENEDGSIRTVAPNAFIFSLLGCVSLGALTPHESGVNVFAANITLENRDCRTVGLETPNNQLTGVAYFIDLGAGRKELNLFLNEFTDGDDGIEFFLRFRAESTPE